MNWFLISLVCTRFPFVSAAFPRVDEQHKQQEKDAEEEILLYSVERRKKASGNGKRRSRSNCTRSRLHLTRCVILVPLSRITFFIVSLKCVNVCVLNHVVENTQYTCSLTFIENVLREIFKIRCNIFKDYFFFYHLSKCPCNV